MDNLLLFSGYMIIWLMLPLIPAWLTYRITPDQDLGLRGPFQGMTLRTTGSFAAYLIITFVSAFFAWPMVNFLIGKEASSSLWQITGRAEIRDSEGKIVSQLPDLRTAYLRVLPRSKRD